MKKVFSICMLICLIILASGFIKTTLFAEEKFLQDYDTDNYFNYTIYSDTNFYTVNKITNKIEHFDNNIVTEYGEYGNTNGKFTEIKFFKVLKNGEFVILDSLNRLQFFDNNFNFIKMFQYIEYNNSFKLLGSIVDIAEDIYSNLYLVDKTNNYILKANSSMENITILNSYTDLQNAKITVLNNSSDIAILQNNKIILNELSIELETTGYEIFSDALNFIYIVSDNEIIKFNNNLSIVSNIKLEKGSEYNINLENGIIYYFLNNQIQKIENFASDISSFEPPIDIFDKNFSTNKANICTVTTIANLLSNPYSNDIIIKLAVNTDLILLANIESSGIDFAFVLYLNNNNYYLGYVENKFLTNKNINETNYQVSPIRNDINYYKYPTKLLNNSAENKLTYNENYTVKREIILDNKTFLEIKINNFYTYVLNQEVINTSTDYIDTFLTTDAKIILINGEKQIHLYDNLNKDNIILTLYKTTNVKVVKSYKNMTEISVLKDNIIYTGFVETKYINYNSNIYMPLTISLISISLLILVVLIIKFKKESTKRKQK